jgi:glycosyltransferase involved in cell wall biosynthesis
MRKRILFISPYPYDTAPSQRFRFEQYIPLLESEGWSTEQVSFWSSKAWKNLYRPGKVFSKAFYLITAIVKRYLLLFKIKRYDFVFIHREFSPVGFPLAVWIIARWIKKKIIFDFDDAIWIPNVSESNRWFSFLKVYDNTRRIIRWSYRVSCGNQYLCNYALQYNSHSVVIPTTLDTDKTHTYIRKMPVEKFVIGWTGTHSTMRYLDEIIPVIEKLEKEFNHLEFRIIADIKPDYQLTSLVYVPWNKTTEADDLAKFSVGIMPLRHDPWSEGKCGFKALQYLSMGIPALVSPVGVNTSIVQHEINGFLCYDLADWENTLRYLILHPEKVEAMAKSCRQTVIDRYSVHAIKNDFLSLFQ